MFAHSFKNSILTKIAGILILAFFLTSCVSTPKELGLTIREFHDTYDPTFKSLGVNFKIEYLNSPRENITVQKKGQDWTITIFSGFINHPRINRNGLKIGLCHEIGHLLAPTAKNALYADERTSDTYAILTCGIVLGMPKADLLEGIESVFEWYRSYPIMQKYPSAQERRDIMIEQAKRIYP